MLGKVLRIKMLFTIPYFYRFEILWMIKYMTIFVNLHKFYQASHNCMHLSRLLT